MSPVGSRTTRRLPAFYRVRMRVAESTVIAGKEPDMVASSDRRQRYGRNWKKLVAIYLVIGAVAYGLIYLALQSGGGSGGGLYG